jgi:hypothetical protein
MQSKVHISPIQVYLASDTSFFSFLVSFFNSSTLFQDASLLCGPTLFPTLSLSPHFKRSLSTLPFFLHFSLSALLDPRILSLLKSKEAYSFPFSIISHFSPSHLSHPCAQKIHVVAGEVADDGERERIRFF